jgi:hypothetical protein
MSNTESNSTEFTPEMFEEAIAKAETSLENLKQRYNQVKEDQLKQEELQERKESLQEQLKDNISGESLKTELNYLEKELEELELRLESSLFSWSSVIEPFWQAVRFGGIGVVIGWILKSLSN